MNSIACLGDGPGDARSLSAFPEAEAGSRAEARLSGIFTPLPLRIAVALDQPRVKTPALRALDLIEDQVLALRPGTRALEPEH